MNNVTPASLAYISPLVERTEPGDKLRAFIDCVRTTGKLLRKGRHSASEIEMVQQKFWSIVHELNLAGESETAEEILEYEIEKAIAIDGERATNGHDDRDDREPPPVESFDAFGGKTTGETEKPIATTTKKPYKLVFARDVTIEGTKKLFLIDGFLGRDETSIWYGPPECGKSTAKIDAACHVATGRPWCGRAVTPGPVLYVAAERGQIVKRRILAWRLDHGIDDFPLAVIDDSVDLRTGRVDADRIIAAAKALATLCGQSVVWAIFDTLSRVLAGGDENSSRDMGLLVLSIDRIYRETSAHCSLVHHVPIGNDGRMRGHGSAPGAVDTTVRVEKHNGLVTVAIDKGSDLPEDEKPRLAFRFKSVTLIDDPHRTASVMVQAEDQAAATTGKKSKQQRKLSDRQQLALDALNSCAADVGKPPPTTFGLPHGLIAITIDQWRDELFRRGIVPKDHKNPRAAFQQIRESLEARAIAAERDGLIWKV